ncbi:MAG: STAS domain-containing protein, partial [Pseudoxanthomonas sp.]
MSLDIKILPPANGSQRVVLGGRLDTHTFEDLDEALEPLLVRDLQSLVLDLAALEYISSAGIRSIFKARKALGVHGGKVLVLNPQAQIQKVF